MKPENKQILDKIGILSTDIDEINNDIVSPLYDTPVTMTSEVTRLNCLNKNLVSLVITGKTIVNLLGVAGDCEDVSLWSTNLYFCTIALDSANKVFGNNSIKMTLTGTNGNDRFDITDRIDKTKYYGISGYVKNGTAVSAYIGFYNGTTTKNSAAVTDTTKFNRAWIKTQPSDYATQNQVVKSLVGASGQYANFDGIMLEEISKADYDNPNWKPSPYVSGDTSVGDTAGRIRSVGKNRINLVQGTFSVVPSYPNNGTYVPVTTRLSHKDGVIAVKPSTTYSVSLNTALSYLLCEFDSNKNILTAPLTWSSSPSTDFTFTTSANTKYVGIAFKIDDTTAIDPNNYQIMINEGAEALPYEEYKETVMPIMYPLRSLPSGVADIQDTKKGKVYKRVEKVSLENLNWVIDTNKTGFKNIKVLLGAEKFIDGSGLLIKYNNKIIPETNYSDTITYADKLNLGATDGYIYLSIPNSESGWGDAYTPTPDEIKAYFNGWKMYIGDGQGLESIYNGSGTKCWIRMDRGGSGVTTVPTTMATNYTPYRLYYQLAQQQEIDMPVSDLVALPNGSLTMENDAQCWVRPTVAYTVNKNSRANLDGAMEQLNRTSRLLAPKQQEGWIKPTLLNGWVNYGIGFAQAGYMKDTIGFVHIKAFLKGGVTTNGTNMFTLPAGYRPAESHRIIAECYTSVETFAVCNVDEYGKVAVLNCPNNQWLAFDFIFKAEQ